MEQHNPFAAFDAQQMALKVQNSSSSGGNDSQKHKTGQLRASKQMFTSHQMPVYQSPYQEANTNADVQINQPQQCQLVKSSQSEPARPTYQNDEAQSKFLFFNNDSIWGQPSDTNEEYQQFDGQAPNQFSTQPQQFTAPMQSPQYQCPDTFQSAPANLDWQSQQYNQFHSPFQQPSQDAYSSHSSGGHQSDPGQWNQYPQPLHQWPSSGYEHQQIPQFYSAPFQPSQPLGATYEGQFNSGMPSQKPVDPSMWQGNQAYQPQPVQQQFHSGQEGREKPQPAQQIHVKSEFLETLNIRIQSGERLTLTELKGHAVESSKDQNGSRLIQSIYEKSNKTQKEEFYNEIKPCLANLITDVFGNYVMQRVVKHCPQDVVLSILQTIKGRLFKLCKNKYGCRVVQKTILRLTSEQQLMLSQELNGKVIECIYDQNANHVIQLLLQQLGQQYIDEIIDEIEPNALNLAFHGYGCRVVQMIIEKGGANSDKVLTMLLPKAVELCKHQYGNYVIQHIIEKGSENQKTLLIREIKVKVLELSKHKFASNVIEKCFLMGNHTHKAELIEQIIKEKDGPHETDSSTVSDISLGEGGDEHAEENKQTEGEGEGQTIKQKLARIPTVLEYMIKDKYGNYVIQKALASTKTENPQLYQELVTNIVQATKSLKKINGYTKHVLQIIGAAKQGMSAAKQGIGNKMESKMNDLKSATSQMAQAMEERKNEYRAGKEKKKEVQEKKSGGDRSKFKNSLLKSLKGGRKKKLKK